MAEAIALSSSIVSFIALAGQVLHGCRFVVEFLDDVVEAPDDLAHLVSEVDAFRSAILAFQSVLQHIRPAMDILPVEKQIKSALYSSSSIINDLEAFITQYQGKRRWKAVVLARRKAKLVKYLDRLARAKADISLAQASTSLILTISHRWKIERLSQNMSGLSAEIIPRDITLADDMSASKQEVQFNNKDRAMSSSLSVAGRHPQAFRPTSDIPRSSSRQMVFTQTYHLWLVTMTICSVITTTQEPLPGVADKTIDEGDEISTTQRSFDFRFHPWITKYCILAICKQPLFLGSLLNADLRFRVYNYVPWDAPIAKACRKGDLTTADRFFREGRASPHDIVVRRTPPGGLASLTDLAWEYWLDLSIRIDNSEESDNMEPFLLKLRNLFNLYRFLVDNGHISSQHIRWDNMTVCRLWILYQKEWSKSPALVSHVGDMTQLVMEEAGNMAPPSFKGCQDLSIVQRGTFLVPSHTYASQPGPVAWIMRDCRLVSMLEAPRFLPYLYIVHAWTNGTASLVLDPEALYLRPWLQYTSPEDRGTTLVNICILAERQCWRLFKDGKGSWESSLQRRLVSSLISGMDPTTERGIACGFDRSSNASTFRKIRSSDSARMPSESLVQHFISVGKADILRSAMLQVGRDPDEITSLFEEEACASIVQELEQLKPTFYLSEVQRHLRHKWSPTCPDLTQRCCRYYMDLALNRGYRRYFPEEDERTMELIREIELENEEDHEEESAPAINGLTEDFWD